MQRRPDSGLGNIRSSPGDPSRNIDWVLMLAVSLLSLIGLAIIYSASRTKFAIGATQPYGFRYVTRQELFLIAAVVVMVIVMSFDYDWWKDQSRFLYGFTLMLLALVMLIGKISGGARLSFDVGPINLQPAEFAKFTVLLVLAAYLAEDRSDVLPYHRFIIGMLIVGAPSALIILQPDLGGVSVLVVMAMGVMLVAGAKFRHMAIIASAAVATVVGALITGLVNEYQLRRFTAFFQQDSTDPALRDWVYQGRNAIRAVATGGVTGKGWLEGPITKARSDIPVQWQDFPFSAIGEEFGLVGAGVLILLYTAQKMPLAAKRACNCSRIGCSPGTICWRDCGQTMQTCTGRGAAGPGCRRSRVRRPRATVSQPSRASIASAARSVGRLMPS